MIHMKKNRLIIVLFFFSFSLLAQVETKKKKFTTQITNPFEKENISTTPESSTSLPSLEYKSVLNEDKSYLKKYSTLNKKEQSKSILEENKKFVNRGDEIRDNLNKKLHDKPIEESFKSNQFLGQFSTKSKYIKIVCRDHEYPDGDRVRILVNDGVLVPDIVLESASKEFYLDLASGFNKIEFLALNQGTSGPNTAAFSVYDDKGNLITKNEWNLTTGVMAKIVVLQDKEDGTVTKTVEEKKE